MDDQVQKAFELAKATREKAHAAYSGFKVGAVVSANGKLYAGNNVENAVNGASVCAERSAVSAMVSDAGESNIDFVVVVAEQGEDFIFPCGVCRQVLFEFTTDPDTPIYVFSTNGKKTKTTMGELLPMVYHGKEFLKR